MMQETDARIFMLTVRSVLARRFTRVLTFALFIDDLDTGWDCRAEIAPTGRRDDSKDVVLVKLRHLT